jgi:hypothetical protein
MFKKASTNTNNENDSSDDVKIVDLNESIAGKPPVDKKSLIIRGIIALALVYYGVTEFVLNEPPVAQPQKVSKSKRSKMPKKKLPTENITKKEEKPTVTAATETVKKEEIVAPVEEIVVAKKEEIAPATLPVEVVPTVAERPKEIEKKIDQLIQEVDKKEPRPEPKPEVKIVNNLGEKKEEVKEDISLKAKIVDDEIYTEAPNYELIGRGLAYNCNEKFWVCLSKPAYIQCNKNMKWNNLKNKPSECATVNVYNSNEDCEKVQKYNVTNSQPTLFCR